MANALFWASPNVKKGYSSLIDFLQKEIKKVEWSSQGLSATKGSCCLIISKHGSNIAIISEYDPYIIVIRWDDLKENIQKMLDNFKSKVVPLVIIDPKKF